MENKFEFNRPSGRILIPDIHSENNEGQGGSYGMLRFAFPSANDRLFHT